jgi:poly-gamma-glutamate synthesis protein (capsule biosynthesis protein)
MPALEEAGFDVVNIANNHIGDWGATAFADTLDNLVSGGLKYIGGGWDKKEATTPVIIEKNDISIGFLGFSDVGPDWMAAKESNPGILLASDPDFDQIIINAAGKADVLVVSFHWGEEYKKYNNRQQELAHRAINDGADIIIGSHPHVIQETEEYEDGLIAYSLGNFIFDQKFSSETMEGLLLEATVTKDGLKDYSKKLFKLDDSYQPQAPVDYASTQ